MNSNKDKRTIFLIICFFVVVCFIYLNENDYIIEELPYRFSKYHTFGEISVTVDGQVKIVDNIEIQMQHEYGEIAKTRIDNGEFKFKEGRYGMHGYIIIMSSSVWNNVDDEYDVIFRINHFNTNWWHVNDLKINIDIETTPQPQARLLGYIAIRDGDNPIVYEFDSASTTITAENNIVMVRTLSP